MKIKFEFLAMIIFDIIYFVIMCSYWRHRENLFPTYKLQNMIFGLFSLILGVFGLLTFVITIFKTNFRDIALNYIGLKTFYMTITIIYICYLFFRFLNTFENFDDFTIKYMVILGILCLLNIFFIIFNIRQIFYIRNNAFSVVRKESDLIDNDKEKKSEVNEN